MKTQSHLRNLSISVIISVIMRMSSRHGLRLVFAASLAVASVSLRVEFTSRACASRVLYPAVNARCCPRAQEGDFAVSLIEPGSDRFLPCYLAATVEHKGDTFAALYPINAPVSLAELSGGRLVPVEETERLVDIATAECNKVNIELMDTPVMLTAQGPGMDDIDEDDLEIDEDDDDDDDDGGEAIVLAEFQYDVRLCPAGCLMCMR